MSAIGRTLHPFSGVVFCLRKADFCTVFGRHRGSLDAAFERTQSSSHDIFLTVFLQKNTNVENQINSATQMGPSETNARLKSSILPAFADSMASRSIFRIGNHPIHQFGAQRAKFRWPEERGWDRRDCRNLRYVRNGGNFGNRPALRVQSEKPGCFGKRRYNLWLRTGWAQVQAPVG
ncbi:MAG: hypothetical protein Ct9H90mP16_20220 [Candidatus Poseidoniales archaeon]|nr:MAG: hypothetical protein Ct9H90mP16_20220 [Candidatus Poseidoniales archaeon]